MNAVTANAVINQKGLNIRIVGASGYLTDTSVVVYSQSISAGTKVAKGTVVTITFRYVGKDD